MAKTLDEIVVYQKSMQLAETVFPLVEQWQYFYQNTIGTQLVRAADSVPANISEGYGRFHFNDKKIFCYYARGSLYETRTHLVLASKRGLISTENTQNLLSLIDLILRMLNPYISSIGTRKPPMTQ